MHVEIYCLEEVINLDIAVPMAEIPMLEVGFMKNLAEKSYKLILLGVHLRLHTGIPRLFGTHFLYYRLRCRMCNYIVNRVVVLFEIFKALGIFLACG